MEMTAATEQKQRTVYSLKGEKTKNTPFVKRKLHTGLEALTSLTLEGAEGHCHSPPGGRHIPISFFPSAAFGEVDEMSCRASTSTKQLYLNHGKPSCFPHPPLLPPAQHRAPGQHIPERNLAGWGLRASHHWGECCQAQGLGQLLHSVETE